MTTVIKSVRIVNKKGLHARASNKFAKLVNAFQSKVRVSHQGESANGESIMDLLMLVAHKGCQIEIEATGPDAQETLNALVALIENGFGELEADRAGKGLV